MHWITLPHSQDRSPQLSQLHSHNTRSSGQPGKQTDNVTDFPILNIQIRLFTAWLLC